MDIFGFWLFLSALVAGSSYDSANKRRTKHETLRALIARGEQADTQLIDELLRDGRGRPPLSLAQWFRISAVLVAFVALGFGVMAGALHASDPDSTFGLLAIGGLCLSVAGGLYCASVMSRSAVDGEP